MRTRRYLVRVGSHRDTERARKTKVRELQVIVFINEKILRLEVTVENAVRMAVEET